MTGAGQNMQSVFGASIFRKLLNQHRYNVIISNIIPDLPDLLYEHHLVMVL